MLQIKTSSGALEQYIAQLKKFDKQQLQKQIADIIIKDIKDRTADHKDVNERPFKPYTPKYKQWKQKKGLSTLPDLKVTGKLLNSLAVHKNGIITTIESTDDPGKVEGVSKLRPFIGITQKTKDKISDLIKLFVGFRTQ